jgi:uncharacterized protein YndB with AHSA1/START domain
MKFYEASVTISASPERVWEVLPNASRYTEWDSGVEKVEREIGHGHKIKVFAKINPGRAFPVKVTELEAPRRMVWRGGMPLGLFKGVRQFNLASEGAITSLLCARSSAARCCHSSGVPCRICSRRSINSRGG